MFLTDSLRNYSLFAVEESIVEDPLECLKFKLLDPSSSFERSA